MLQKIIDELIEKYGPMDSIVYYSADVNTGIFTGLNGFVCILFKNGIDVYIRPDLSTQSWDEKRPYLVGYRRNFMVNYCRKKFGIVGAPYDALIDLMIEKLCQKHLSTDDVNK